MQATAPQRDIHMSIHPQGRPPFRADHVGSLLRPASLRQAFRQHAAGEIAADEFIRIQDQAIRDAVRMQEEVGLPVVTDGEFRRGSYWASFVERTDGLDIRDASFRFRDDGGREVGFTAPYASGKLKRTRPIALDEFLFLRDVANATPKVTLPSPSTMHFFRCADFADPKAYRDVEEFFNDLAVVFRQEIADVVAAGCRYVQLDEVALALLCDPSIQQKVRTAGLDPDRLADLYVAAINSAVRDCPAEVVTAVHMCRGNFKGHYLGEGGYGSVAERFFAGVRVNHFLLEYDTARAGDFLPLRYVPKDKGAVLGLISSKTPVLERLDVLQARVGEAARYIDADRLALGPQCGFASTVAGNPLTEADQRAKLGLAVAAARAIWGNV
jgi:5-methyltetrahydropteroyltriglutamate--homocysteine methyltransferase